MLDDFKSEQSIEFLFFFGHNPSKDGTIIESCLSQWWICNFTIDTDTYCCMEQFMMAEKARLFGDEGIEQQIMECTNLKEMKALGRKIQLNI